MKLFECLYLIFTAQSSLKFQKEEEVGYQNPASVIFLWVFFICLPLDPMPLIIVQYRAMIDTSLLDIC